MGTVITIVILTTLVQTVCKHLSKPKYEAKEDAPNDPTHGGQGQPTRLGAGHLRDWFVSQCHPTTGGQVPWLAWKLHVGEGTWLCVWVMIRTILSLDIVIVKPQLSQLQWPPPPHQGQTALVWNENWLCRWSEYTGLQIMVDEKGKANRGEKSF